MPFPFQTGEVQRIRDEFGVPVTIAGVTAKCTVRDSDEEIAAGPSSHLIGRAIVVRTEPGTFPAAAEDVAVTADYPAVGTAYTVVSVLRESPQTVAITLAKV